MLSESQLWRRLRSRSGNRHRLKHDLEYERYKLEASRTQKNGNTEQQACSSSSVSILYTNGAADSQSNSPMGARKVRFNPVIRVCLVPCRADFRGDFYLLFWEREDYQAFKEDAVRELRAHWTQHHTSVKEAIFDMYQPSPDGVDHVMAELAPPPPAACRRMLAHVDSMGVMANLAKSTGANSGNSNSSSGSTTSRMSSNNVNNSTNSSSIAKDSDFKSNNTTSGSAAGARPISHEGADPSTGNSYAQPLPEDTAAEDAPRAYSHNEHNHFHDRYGSEAETSFGDFVVEDDSGMETAGSGLSGYLTSGDICPVTPMRCDHLSTEREGEETAVVDASALFTPEMSSAPYRSHRSDGPPRTLPLPQPSRTSPASTSGRGAESASASSSATKEGSSSGGGSVRLILCEESPSSCASSFEAPILIC